MYSVRFSFRRALSEINLLEFACFERDYFKRNVKAKSAGCASAGKSIFVQPALCNLGYFCELNVRL